MFTGGEDLRFKQWDVEQMKVSKDYGPVHYGTILSIAVTPCGSFAFTAGEDETVKQWDIEDRMEVIDYDVNEKIGCMSVSPSGKWVFTGSKECSFKKWALVDDDEVE